MAKRGTIKGFGSINSNLNSSKNNLFGLFTGMGLQTLITLGRIKSIVLNDTHPRFKELGGWNSLGMIEYNDVQNPTSEQQLYPVARPLDPSFKNFPLINEIVYILSLPNTNIGNTTTATFQYYINTIGIWNHPHHNAFPENSNTLPPSQQKDYEQTQAGSVRRVTDQSTEIFLGETFKEKSNIHPLLPFEGDRITEGRWGNSIRFGSTVKGQIEPNDWSSVGEDGDPIIVLRNGQGQNPGALGEDSDKGWLPITELINNDDSSIYLTSTQKIPVNVSSTNDNYFSYKSNPPQNPKEYAGKQIILNSGRLLFNTTNDHLLLSSKKSINLNAIGSINFDTSQPIILQTDPISNGGGVFLGDKNADESVLLGDSTVELLKDLLEELRNLTNSLSIQVGVPVGSPLAPTDASAAAANNTISNLLGQLDNLKSKTVKIT
jgi:hypothetical protein